jgi:hypothetical protein
MEGNDVGGTVLDSSAHEVVEVMCMLLFVPQRGFRAFADADLRVPAEGISGWKGEAVDPGVDEIRYTCVLFDMPEMEFKERGSHLAKEINHDDAKFHERG